MSNGNQFDLSLFISSSPRSKHLLRLCKMTHAFQMQTQGLVDRAKKRESAADKKKYRESYISGDISWSDLDSSMTTTSFSEMELQRRSVVSNVSSVTTSGIVSDERSPLEKNLSEGRTNGYYGVVFCSVKLNWVEQSLRHGILWNGQCCVMFCNCPFLFAKFKCL